MNRIINGQVIPYTPEELAQVKKQETLERIREKSRHLTESEVVSMLLTQNIQTIEVDDNTALRMRDFYPEWETLIGKTVNVANFKFQYNGELYKTIHTTHTFQSNWVPNVGTESLYVRIDEVHDGTVEDPISYNGNIELVEGLYYIQDDAIYKCTRSTGIPVYNTLAELVGIYVENAF